MQFEESKQSRQLMGSLDRGEDLVEQLDRIADLQQIKAGTLRGLGTLQDVELVRRDHASGEWINYVNAHGPFDVVQLTAHIASLGAEPAIRIEAMLSAQGPAGPQLVFGQIRKAKVVEFEFAVDAFDDLVAERRLDSGILILAEVRQLDSAPKPLRERKPVERIAEPKLGKAEPVQGPLPITSQAKTPEADEPPAPEFSWDDAAKAAQEVKPVREKPTVHRPPRVGASSADHDEDEDDHGLMEPGDILDHPKLGRCRIIKVEGDEFAHIRLARGPIRKLALEVCDIRFVGEEDGRNVFQVRIKR